MTATRPTRIALLGFGEAARAFLAGWRREPGFAADVVAFDVKTLDPATRAAKLADYAADGVTGVETAVELVAGADLVFSLVTADRAREAALSVAAGLAPGALVFDGNSCAPQTKAGSAATIDAAGGRYVDMAVMAPVHPRLHRTPLLICGPHAAPAAEALNALSMSVEIRPGPVGSASAVKMVRSVMMKGLEALVCECVLAGRLAGVDDVVLESLDDTYPGFDWKKRAAYMLERVMTHGIRRSAEMAEVAKTVDLLGLDGAMSRAAVGWQARVGGLRLDARAGDLDDHRSLADMILARLAPSAQGETP